jgi:hypothetical protein
MARNSRVRLHIAVETHENPTQFHAPTDKAETEPRLAAEAASTQSSPWSLMQRMSAKVRLVHRSTMYLVNFGIRSSARRGHRPRGIGL